MTVEVARAAILAGRDLTASLPGNVVLLGEMGTGNTSSVTLLASLLLNRPLSELVGAGTGLDAARLAHKRTVLGHGRCRH